MLSHQSEWMGRICRFQRDVSSGFAQQVPKRLESVLGHSVGTFELSDVYCTAAGASAVFPADAIVFRAGFSQGEKPGSFSYTVLDAQAPAMMTCGYFGFDSEEEAAAPVRAMSRIERGVTEEIVGALVGVWAEVWSRAACFDGATPDWVWPVPETLPALVVSCFSYEIFGYTGAVLMAMPFDCVGLAFESTDLDVQSRLDEEGVSCHSERHLAGNMMQAPVQLRGELAHRMVTLRRLGSLAPGDLIPVQWPTTAHLCVGSVRFCTAKVVSRAGQLALEIVGRCER